MNSRISKEPFTGYHLCYPRQRALSRGASRESRHDQNLFRRRTFGGPHDEPRLRFLIRGRAFVVAWIIPGRPGGSCSVEPCMATSRLSQGFEAFPVSEARQEFGV